MRYYARGLFRRAIVSSAAPNGRVVCVRAQRRSVAARALLEAPGAEECRALGGVDWAATP